LALDNRAASFYDSLILIEKLPVAEKETIYTPLRNFAEESNFARKTVKNMLQWNKRGGNPLIVPAPRHVMLYDAVFLILLVLVVLGIIQCAQNNRRIVKHIERCEAKLQECGELAKQEFRRFTELEHQLALAERLVPEDVHDEIERLRSRLKECREESAREIAALRMSIATLAGHRKQTPPHHQIDGLDSVNYKQGLCGLGEHLLRINPGLHGEFLVYEQRLRENIADERYGKTDAIRADRARILDAMNDLSRRATGKSFAEWAQK